MHLLSILLVFLVACGSKLVTDDERSVRVPDAQSGDADAQSGDPDAHSGDGGDLDADAGPAVSAACPEGVYSGDFVVRVAADIATLRGCTRVAGSLAFETKQLTTLDGVESLATVDGTLSIGPIYWEDVGRVELQPSSLVHGLAALSNLRKVGELHLVGLTLETLAPLATLEHADLLLIYRLEQLDDLNGLERLSFNAVDLSGNSRLRDLTALHVPESLQAFLIYGSPKLESLVPLAPLKRVTAVSLGRLGLRSLDGLQNLEELETLRIADCNELVDLRGLGTLGHEVSFFDNASLQALTGVVRSRTPSKLTLENLPKLTALAGVIGPNPGSIDTLQLGDLAVLETLAEVAGIAPSSLSVRNMPLLRDLHGLQQVRTLKYLGLGNLPALTDATGLAGLVRNDEYMELSELPLLTSLAWLSKLESANVLLVNRLNGITNLRGLEKLTRVDSLTIESNLKLMSLSGFSSLQSAMYAPTITGNSALPQCEVDRFLDRLGFSPSPDANGPPGMCGP
jgi:hypothetical protein